MAKRKFIPKLQYLMNKIVIPRFDKKHRIYFENKLNDETPRLYLSKYCTDYKVGIPSRITHIIDCGTHAYITIEPAKFLFPSKIQTAKFIASVADDAKYGYVNPIISSIGNVIEITYMKENEKASEHFIIGMAFGTLWKIPYQDYRKYVPKDIDRNNLLHFDQYLYAWYREHPTKAPTEEEVNKYLNENHLMESGRRLSYALYDPTSRCKYAKIINIVDGRNDDTIYLAYEKPCIMPPYRSDKVCKTLAYKACDFETELSKITKIYDVEQLH